MSTATPFCNCLLKYTRHPWSSSSEDGRNARRANGVPVRPRRSNRRRARPCQECRASPFGPTGNAHGRHCHDALRRDDAGVASLRCHRLDYPQAATVCGDRVRLGPSPTSPDRNADRPSAPVAGPDTNGRFRSASPTTYNCSARLQLELTRPQDATGASPARHSSTGTGLPRPLTGFGLAGTCRIAIMSATIPEE